MALADDSVHVYSETGWIQQGLEPKSSIFPYNIFFTLSCRVHIASTVFAIIHIYHTIPFGGKQHYAKHRKSNKKQANKLKASDKKRKGNKLNLV